MPFIFEPGGGTTKMHALTKNGQVIKALAPGRAVFVLVDNDKEGRDLYTTSKLGDGGVWKQDNSNKVYWCRLPFLDELSQLMAKCKIDKSAWPGCLENLFSAELKHKAIQAGVLAVTKKPHNEFLSDHFEKITEYLDNRDDHMHYHILSPAPEKKDTFAEWVVTQANTNPKILEPLKKTMLGLNDILASIKAEAEAEAENFKKST